MKIAEFVNYLSGLGIELRSEENRLIVGAPKGTLTTELRASIRERKTDIIKFLQEVDAINATSVPPLRPASRDANAPLSFAQESLWILDQIEPNTSAYNVPAAFGLKGKLDTRILNKALNEIVKRHEVLRTTFGMDGDNPVQVITPSLVIELPLVDLSDRPVSQRVTEVAQFLETNARRPFNLAEGPLLRSTVLRLEEEEHILFIMFHHAVFDGWSLGVFLRELDILYEAFKANKPSPLSGLPIQYADYSIWQRKWLQEKELQRQLAYWREKLSGTLPVLQFPTSYRRPPVRTARGSALTVQISKTFVQSLSALGRSEDATLFMLILTAFKILLHRYTGQEDLCVGWPITTRTAPETEGLIGMFLNTLVLRTHIEPALSFRELLTRVRTNCIEAYNHPDVPFERLVKEVKIERDLSRTPLYQVMISFQSEINHATGISGILFEQIPLHNSAAQTDLRLELIETDDGLNGILEYSADLFHPAMVDRLVKNFHVLLAGVCSEPDRPIEELPILADEERHQILSEWNATQVNYPEDVCLHKLFERQAEKTPDRIALEFGNQCLTYKELNERTNQLAHFLQRLGAGPETLVGVYMERSLEMVISLYGILKAGGAYVPLDPEYPPDRVAYMIEDTEVPVVLTQEHMKASLPEHQAKVICLDSDWHTISKEKTDNPESGATAENLAYVIYTSGSTGKPKGVMNEHRGIVNRLLWMQDEYRLLDPDRVLQKTPFSFDVSVWEFFWPLLVGARLVVAPPAAHRDPASLIRLIAEREITTIHFVPSMLQVFLRENDVEKCASLKRVICSGEALPYELQERFFKRLSAELHNLYGPTEAAVDVTFWKCQQGSDHLTVPIGRPVANTQMYVLDQLLQPVPIGVTGELHIGGVQVARGYLNRPELTEEKFIADPFGSKPGSRLYKTGDLVRCLPDGAIEYLGRNDFQVKVRGLRIELGEIESVIAQHPQVSEVVTVVSDDTSGDKRIVAYLVARQNKKVSIPELRNSLREKLPDYMVPSAFVQLEEFPLLENGKVNRKALPEPPGDRPDLASVYISPRTEAEKVISKVWQNVLGIDKVGINDNFFELGGTSLLLVRVLQHLREAFTTELRVSNLIEYPTIGSLGEYLSKGDDRHGRIKGVADRVEKKRGQLGRLRKQRQIAQK